MEKLIKIAHIFIWVIFLNKNILITLIKITNVSSAYSYLNKIGYNFTLEEINLLLPYIRRNLDLLDKDKKDILLDNIPYQVTPYCKYQLNKLFNEFIK